MKANFSIISGQLILIFSAYVRHLKELLLLEMTVIFGHTNVIKKLVINYYKLR